MERADDMEHILFKRISGSLLSDTGFRVVEDTLFTGTCRTYIAAGIAADALGELAAPECEPFIGGHCFEFGDHIKAMGIEDFAVLTDQFVISDVFFALAGLASFFEGVSLRDGGLTVDSVDDEVIAIFADAGDTGDTLGFQHFAAGLALAGDTDDIDFFPVDAVFSQQLVEGIGIAGFQKDEDFTLFKGFP